jgi:hypothetical protein
LVLALRPAIMRHDPGLAASPPVRYKLEMERSGYFPLRRGRRGAVQDLIEFEAAEKIDAAQRVTPAD